MKFVTHRYVTQTEEMLISDFKKAFKNALEKESPVNNSSNKKQIVGNAVESAYNMAIHKMKKDL